MRIRTATPRQHSIELPRGMSLTIFTWCSALQNTTVQGASLEIYFWHKQAGNSYICISAEIVRQWHNINITTISLLIIITWITFTVEKGKRVWSTPYSIVCVAIHR